MAVVTLNWNGAAYLRECLDSILASDYSSFQVIVVDNGSGDNSLELLDKLYGGNPRVRVIRNAKNLGYSKGMNLGMKAGFEGMNAEYCLVMNNDTRLDPHAISALVEVAQREENAAFVTGKVYYQEAPDTFQTVGKYSHPVLINGGNIGRGEIDRGQYNEDRELAFCDDIFWLISRQIYEVTGGYDPEFFLQAEDFDWQLRAKNMAFKIMYANHAKIWHKESMALGKLSAKKAYYDARNPIIAVAKNCRPEVTIEYARGKSALMLRVFIRYLLQGKLRIAFNTACGYASALVWLHRNKSVIPSNSRERGLL